MSIDLNRIASDSIEYSLYLVTGRDLLPPGKDYYDSLEEALKGGVSIVQIREKTCDTGEFLSIATKSKEICRKYHVPLLINDRIDIALAMGADGVHLGQTDMPIAIARRLLPEGSIIGLSCSNADQATAAVNSGLVDYIGVGPVWGTQTKQVTSPIIGVRGVGEILQRLQGSRVKAVAIAGIKHTNALRTLHGAASQSSRLDGIAVVSDIMASPDPFEAAKRLSSILKAFKSVTPVVFSLQTPSAYLDQRILVQNAASLLTKVRESGPLVHQITNIVAANQSANVTLALGASPIMATAVHEMEDLSKVSGALLINFGTITDKNGMIEAGKWANLRRKPIVFDPVAVGATQFRREAASELLNTWQASVIKGNAAEIGTLANSTEVQTRGVDSIGKGFADPAKMVQDVALKERCIVVMSGATDWISDGQTVLKVSNGNKLLADITASGCILGTCIATFCAAATLAASQELAGDERLVKGDMLTAAVGGILALTIASEFAAARPEVHGSGSFVPALIDELYNLTPEKIMNAARIEIV